MKFKLLQKIFAMSKLFFYLACIQSVFATVAAANSGHAQPLEEVSISCDWKGISLDRAFADVQNQTDFFFTYNYEVIKQIAISNGNPQMALVDLLKYLSGKTGLEFSIFQDIIYVLNEEAVQSEVKGKNSPLRIEVPENEELGQALLGSEYKVIYKVESLQTRLDQIVRGKVTATNGEPLIGAAVFVKETGQGTVTGNNGSFTIAVPDEGETTLVVSYIGYRTAEVRVSGGQAQVDIQLVVASTELDEVVVIGYGEQQKTKVTGALSNIGGEELNQYPATSFEQQLVGRVAGLQINEFGAPGSDAQIVIRGVGTLTAGSNPLIVVDGFPLTEGSSLSSINPKDIESIDILKDAASAAIYGSRAANGVILIKTKDGELGKPKITLDVYTGIQQGDIPFEFVGAYEAAQYLTEARDWGYVSRNPAVRRASDDRATRLANGANRRDLRINYLEPYLEGQPGLVNTNWLDEVFRNAPMSNYLLSVAGGTEKTKYYISGNYFHQEGIVIGTALNRYNLSFKVNTELSERLEFGLSVNSAFSAQDFFENNSSWDSDPLSSLDIMYPFFSPYDARGNLNISEQIIASTPEDAALGENIVAMIENIKNDRREFRTFGNAYLKLNLLEGLDFKTSLGGDYRNRFFDFYNPSFVGQYRTQAPKPAIASETSGKITNFQIENLLTYNRTFGEHQLDVIAGYTFQKEEGTQTRVTGSGIPDDNVTNIAGASSYAIDADRYIWTQISYLSRIQYAFKNRYLLSAAIRQDGSSRFGDDTKWGTFPSLSAGWILSRESFFPDSDVFSFAKIRGSWGQSGNSQIGSFSSKALVTPSDYVYGNSLGAGFATTTSPNPNLSWETNSSFDVGLNLGFFGNRLNLTLDYYNSETSDLLLNVPVPEQSGFSNYITNIGKVRNSGFEVELGVQGFSLGPVRWDINANFSTNENEVLSLAPGQTEIRAGQDGAWRTIVGRPIAEMYGYNIVGVFKTAEEIAATPHLSGTLTGDYIVEDVDSDGRIDDGDRIPLGTYAPKFTYGLSSNFTYKNFGLGFSFVGVEGRKIYDWSIAFLREVGEGFGIPSTYYYDNRYHPENNPDGFFAQPNAGNFSAARRNTRTGSIYFQDGDYLRLRNVQFSYTLPASALSRIGIISQARIYLIANNLFTITDFRGFNPDGTAADILQSGYQRGNNYPIARTFFAGFNVTF